jgi:hypothetical protein
MWRQVANPNSVVAHPNAANDKKIRYTSRFVRVILAQGPC